MKMFGYIGLALLCAALSGCSAYPAEALPGTRKTAEPETNDVPREITEPVNEDNTAPEKSDRKSDKIDDAPWEIIEKADNGEIIPVSIWITDIDHEEIEKRVEAEVGLSRDIIDRRSKALHDEFAADGEKQHSAEAKQLADDVQIYTTAQRSIAKEMHTAANEKFIEAYLSGAEDVCAYEYFPVIDCGVTRETILRLVSLGCVESVSSNADNDIEYQIDFEAVPESTTAV